MKNNQLVFAFLTVLFLGFMSGCGSIADGDVISEGRAAGGFFNGVSSDGVGNVNVHFGESHGIVVTTDRNLQYRVLTTVSGNILRITQSPGTFNPTKLTIDVHLPVLSRVYLHGAGSFTINSGSASEVNMTLTGTGNIYAQNFQVQNLTINHSGVGTARIWAANSLSGNHSGDGYIYYRGSPVKNIDSTGSGGIRAL